MVRTQIQLTELKAHAVREVARRRGTSVAEVIRRCIDASLADQQSARAEAYRHARAMIGALEDETGAVDVATAHDRYLAEAFE